MLWHLDAYFSKPKICSKLIGASANRITTYIKILNHVALISTLKVDFHNKYETEKQIR